MPGKHTNKTKRFSKRVNESSAWLFAGPGNPVYMGNPDPVSQFNPSGQVSPGAGYIPDEVAKMLVKESGLRKSDTIPKRVIESYLESMRLSKGLAVDVARVLRDVYGITPTFDESSLYAISGSLIEELTGAMNESFPMPFAFDDEPRILNEVDLVGSFIQREFMESTDENYDLVLGALALLPYREFCDVVDFHEWVGEDAFNQIEDLAINGPDGMAEMVLEGLCWPSRIKLMPEHVQDLFEDAADDVIKAGTAKLKSKMPAIPPVPKGGPAKPASKSVSSKPGRKIPSIKAKPTVPSLKKQMAKHGKDLASDPLAAKKPGAALAAHREKQDKDWDAAHAAAKARHADEPEKTVPKGSRLKRAGTAAIGAMKKVGGAFKKASDFLHTPGKAVGHAVKSVAKGTAKAHVGLVTGAFKAVGHVGGALAKGVVGGFTGKNHSNSGSDHDSDGDSKPKKKSPGVLGHIGRAIGRFAGHVKKGFKDASPGIAHVAGGGKEPEKAKEPEAEPKKKERMATSQVGQESVYASGSLIGEVEAMLGGQSIEDESEEEETVRSPAEVVGTLEAASVVDQAVCEALSEMDWDGVAKMAGFMMLVPQRFLGLVQSFKEGTDEFRAEWHELEESGTKPSWMNIGSFVALAKLSLDEGVIPRIVYFAGKALQAADEAVAAHVNESYPELGQTVYGPAGDPKEGPQLAKSYLTPQPTGTMTPTKSDCTTRMFSDPADREKARKAKLADVMDALNGMRAAAAAAGVAPEGMFLNLYRDMHREKIRYS